MRHYKQKKDAAAAQYKQHNYLMTNSGYTGKQINKIDMQYQITFEHWMAKNDKVLCYEEEHNIAVHWAPISQEYIDALVVVYEQKYQCTTDELERLVVQHLF